MYERAHVIRYVTPLGEQAKRDDPWLRILAEVAALARPAVFHHRNRPELSISAAGGTVVSADADLLDEEDYAGTGDTQEYFRQGTALCGLGMRAGMHYAEFDLLEYRVSSGASLSPDFDKTF